MTALKQYERLESTGLWRASPEAQRRDVHVSFGKASLIIRDHNDTALTHWSLAAVERRNPGIRPALFHPGDDSGEQLELDDPTMIDAIEKVRRTLERHRPKAGSLRLAVLLSIIGMIAGLGIFWLPGALANHTLTVVPESKRIAIGSDLLRQITSLTGETCNSELGSIALTKLTNTVLEGRSVKAHVMRDMARDWINLPGGILLISRRLVEDHDVPDVAAGYMLEAERAKSEVDPLSGLLAETGTRATLQLLTTGEIKEAYIRDYAEVLLAREGPEFDFVELLPYFETAEIPTTPFAYARDITGETVLELIEADPFRGTRSPTLLSDAEWVSLQEICLQ